MSLKSQRKKLKHVNVEKGQEMLKNLVKYFLESYREEGGEQKNEG